MLLPWRVGVVSVRGLSRSLGLRGRLLPEDLLQEERDKPKKQEQKLSGMYKKLGTWKDQDALTSHLYSNILYFEPEQDKHGLVVINKPYGLPLHSQEDSPYSLESSSKGLAEMLEVAALYPIKTAERWNSGVTVLGSLPETGARYKKCMDRLKTSRSLGSAFLCITKGHSRLDRTETVDVRLVDCPQVNSPVIGKVHREPEISRKLVNSHKAFRGGVNKCHVYCGSVVGSNRVEASLQEIHPSHTNNHFIQVDAFYCYYFYFLLPFPGLHGRCRISSFG